MIIETALAGFNVLPIGHDPASFGTRPAFAAPNGRTAGVSAGGADDVVRWSKLHCTLYKLGPMFQ
jgi:hypothetical protein